MDRSVGVVFPILHAADCWPSPRHVVTNLEENHQNLDRYCSRLVASN